MRSDESLSLGADLLALAAEPAELLGRRGGTTFAAFVPMATSVCGLSAATV